MRMKLGNFLQQIPFCTDRHKTYIATCITWHYSYSMFYRGCGKSSRLFCLWFGFWPCSSLWFVLL